MIKQKFENEEKRFRFLELKHPGLPRQEGTYFYENKRRHKWNKTIEKVDMKPGVEKFICQART